jgi:hypothetical protein
MVRKNSDGQSAESIARANRQRVAQEDGARAMAGIEQKAIAVRKNMERLRALRETRETQEAILEQASPAKPTKKGRRVRPKPTPPLEG